MLYLLRRLRKTPEDHFRQDYETLIRMARRCAYDFRHAADDVGVDKPFMDKDVWAIRANWWISMFAKGNPGKDYRMQNQQEIMKLRAQLTLCIDAMSEAGMEIPDGVDDLPF